MFVQKEMGSRGIPHTLVPWAAGLSRFKLRLSGVEPFQSFLVPLLKSLELTSGRMVQLAQLNQLRFNLNRALNLPATIGSLRRVDSRAESG